MSVKVIDRGWNRIKKELGLMKDSSVKIGVLSDAGAYASKGNSAVNLADVATFNEFGTSTIPARPFMAQTFETQRGIVDATIAVMKDEIFVGSSTVNRSLNKIGVWYKGLIQKTFRDGEFAPNAPATIRIKESSKPLIDTGRLRQSIDYEVEVK